MMLGRGVDYMGLLTLILNFVELFNNIVQSIHRKKTNKLQKVQHLKKMREEVKRINLFTDKIQLRNYQKNRSMKSLYFNQYSPLKGVSYVPAYLSRIDEFGIWVDIDISSLKLKTVSRDDKEYMLSSYIPFEWIKIMDYLDEGISSDFSDKDVKYIIYVKAPLFMFPYKTQYLIDESPEVIEVSSTYQKNTEESFIQEKRDCLNLSYFLDREIAKAARENRKYFAYRIKEDEMKV